MNDYVPTLTNKLKVRADKTVFIMAEDDASYAGSSRCSTAPAPLAPRPRHGDGRAVGRPVISRSFTFKTC